MVDNIGMTDTPSGSSTPSGGSTPSARRLNRKADFLPGKVVFKNFKVLKKLGEGGMGAVYKVTNLLLEKTVALKVLPIGSITETELLRFQNEARAAGRLTHPNIASTFDLAIDKDGVPYLSMEYVSGPTLKQVLEKRGRLGVNDFFMIFKQLCQALSHAHSKEVVHRDLKPANIIIELKDQDLRPVLVDFGVAKLVDADGHLTRTGACIGTPLYVSPEQISGHPGSKKSDIYSMGCVMFHALSGDPPFQGASSFDTLILHKQAEIPIEILCAIEELPDGLTKLIERMMAKNPDDRPQSFVEICEVLDACVHIVPQDKPEHTVENEENDPLRAWVASTDLAVPDSRPTGWPKILLIVVLLAAIPLAVMSHFLSRNDKVRRVGLNHANPSQIPFTADEKVAALVALRNNLVNGKTEIDCSSIDLVDSDMKVFELCKHGADVQVLNLRNNFEVTDDGLKYLKHVNPTRLDLSSTKAEHLQYLSAMTKLEDLDLAETPIQDDDLQFLANLQNLKRLNLAGTNIHDAGLNKLGQLKKLERLITQDCPISAAALDALQEKIPTLSTKNRDDRFTTALKTAMAKRFTEPKLAYQSMLKILHALDDLKLERNSFRIKVYAGLSESTSDLDEAETYVSDAIRIAMKPEAKRRIAEALVYHARRLVHVKNYKRAIKTADLSAKLYADGGDPDSTGAIFVRTIKTTCLYELGQLNLAEENARNVLASLKTTPKNFKQLGFVLSSLAGVEEAQGRFPAAAKHYREAIQAFDQYNTEDAGSVGALHGLSRCEEKLGNLKAACDSCKRGIAAAKKHRMQPAVLDLETRLKYLETLNR